MCYAFLSQALACVASSAIMDATPAGAEQTTQLVTPPGTENSSCNATPAGATQPPVETTTGGDQPGGPPGLESSERSPPLQTVSSATVISVENAQPESVSAAPPPEHSSEQATSSHQHPNYGWGAGWQGSHSHRGWRQQGATALDNSGAYSEQGRESGSRPVPVAAKKKPKKKPAGQDRQSLLHWKEWEFRQTVHHIVSKHIQDIFNIASQPHQERSLCYSLMSDYVEGLSQLAPKGRVTPPDGRPHEGELATTRAIMGTSRETERSLSPSSSVTRRDSRKRRRTLQRDALTSAVNFHMHHDYDRFMEPFLATVKKLSSSMRRSSRSQASFFEETAIGFAQRFLLDKATFGNLITCRPSVFREVISSFDEQKCRPEEHGSLWRMPDGQLRIDLSKEIGTYTSAIRKRQRGPFRGH